MKTPKKTSEVYVNEAPPVTRRMMDGGSEGIWEMAITFEPKDIITIILALYGAILSSVLAIREFKKERRLVKAFLDYVEYYSRYKLTIVNIGYRPITLVRGSVELLQKHGSRYLADPLSYKVDQQISNAFPVTIKDGEHIVLDVPDFFDSPFDMERKKDRIEAYVRDAEGIIYTTKKIRVYNPKSDNFS